MSRLFSYRAAQAVSWLFNPLGIATCLYIWILWDLDMPLRQAYSCLLVFIAFAVAFPLAPLFYLRRRAVVQSLFVPDRARRGPLLAFATLSTSLGAAALVFLNAPQSLIAVLVSFAVLAGAMGVLNCMLKVSLHAAGVWAGWLILVLLCGSTAAWFIPLPLLVSWSRVALKAHTPGQVILGSGAGGTIAGLIFHCMTQG